MTTYSQIIKRAFKVSWSQKTIWLFGLFAAFLGAGGAITKSFGLNVGQSVVFNFVNTLISVDFFSLETARNIITRFSQNPTSAIISLIIFLILLIVTIIILVLSIISQSAIIDNVSKKDLGKKTTYTQGLNFGLNRFWSLLGLNVISKIAVLITFLFLINIAVNVSETKTILVGLVYGLLILVTAIVLLIVRYAICFLVIYNYSFVESIKKAVNTFFKYWITTVEVAFILFLFEIFIAALIRIFTTIDAFIIYIILVGVSILKLTAVSKLIMFLIVTTVSIIAILFFSFFTVFSWAIWTILLTELQKNNITSKLKTWLRIK